MNFQRNVKVENRIAWMDVYKGILIILVVIGHATGKFNAWIYQFHMAAFFFSSGYLSNIEKKSCVPTIIKKILTIILPLCTLSIAGALCNAFLNKIGIYELLFGSSFSGIGFTISQILLHGLNNVQYWGTFWFLTTLFGVELLHIILCRLNGKKANWLYLCISVILFYIGYWFISYNIKPKIWIIETDLVLIAQIYYVFGIFVRKIKFKTDILGNTKIGYLVPFIIAILTAIWGIMNGITVDFPSRNFHHPCAEFIVAIASIYIIFLIASYISDNIYPLKIFFSFCGRNSLGIMILHFAFFKVFMIWLYKTGRATTSQITNVVLPTELANTYWFLITIFSLIASLFIWCIAIRIPGIRFMLGQDGRINRYIIEKFLSISWIETCRRKMSNGIDGFWKRVNKFVSAHKLLCTSTFGILILFSIPMYRTGIIINDELQARCLAMQGFWTFYKHEFGEWMGQGRLLAAPINSFTKYLSYIGVNIGTTSFRIGTIIILLAVIGTYGVLVYKIFKNRYLAGFTSLIALSCMPIAFEHCSPNAFVSFLGIPLMLVFISASCYTDYIETRQKNKVVIAMLLYFMSMMSYEAFITFVPLYFMLVLGKLGLKSIKEDLKLYLIPLAAALLFLICYIVSSKLSPSAYEGNQLGFNTIIEPLTIVLNLFVVCIPGFFVAFPRYQYFKTLYFNMETSDYIRIILFAITFLILGVSLLRKSSINEHKQKSWRSIVKHIYIIFCGLCYMLLPSIPNALSSMYQGIVGFTGTFLTLPITFFEYFAAVFVITYVIWLICSYIGKKYYLIMVGGLCLLVINIQQMNDIFSKEQHSNFNRLTEIEAFLQTDVVRNLPIGKYASEDLYMQQNLLAIHDSYWTTYCGNILGEQIQIAAKSDGTEIGNIYYDGDNFVIVNSQYIYVLSRDQESSPKAIQITDGNYELFHFQNENYDGGFYTYYMTNNGRLFSKEGYLSNYGYNFDGWLEKNSSFIVTTGEKGLIHGMLYYPGTQFEGKKVLISINEIVVQKVEITDSLSYFDLIVSPGETVEMTIECNFEYENKGEDIRDLSIVLSELAVE